MNQLVPIILLPLLACGQTKPAAHPAAPPHREPVASTDSAGDETENQTDPSPEKAEGETKVFQIRESDTAGDARGVRPSKIEPTRSEAALRLFVVDKDKGPIEGIVIALTDPAGARYYTEETDAQGYAETLVPVGKTYTLTYLTLGRKEISAKVTVSDKPNQNLKLTLRYKREEYPTGSGAAEAGGFVLKGVQFETGKARLTADSFAKLDTVVEYMTHKKSARIEIAGHTDDVGNPAANKALSQRRANACRDYLVSQGIGRDRITTVGYGAERPILSNDTATGREQNRRIEAREL